MGRLYVRFAKGFLCSGGFGRVRAICENRMVE
jgi:hypothetical protein